MYYCKFVAAITDFVFAFLVGFPELILGSWPRKNGPMH